MNELIQVVEGGAAATAPGIGEPAAIQVLDGRPVRADNAGDLRCRVGELTEAQLAPSYRLIQSGPFQCLSAEVGHGGHESSFVRVEAAVGGKGKRQRSDGPSFDLEW